MADGKEVLKSISRRPGVTYTALTPNLKGFHAAVSLSIQFGHFIPELCTHLNNTNTKLTND